MCAPISELPSDMSIMTCPASEACYFELGQTVHRRFWQIGKERDGKTDKSHDNQTGRKIESLPILTRRQV